MCGAFGIGGTRAQDVEALRRAYAHLEPGGRLVLYLRGRRVRRGAAAEATVRCPTRRTAACRAAVSAGRVPGYALRHRTVELDVEPLDAPRAAGVAVARRRARGPRDARL